MLRGDSPTALPAAETDAMKKRHLRRMVTSNRPWENPAGKGLTAGLALLAAYSTLSGTVRGMLGTDELCWG